MVSIDLDRVTFSYRASEEEPLFPSLSLTISPGEWVVVGPFGAGKTTLVKLLKWLLQPQTGEIKGKGSGLTKPGETTTLKQLLELLTVLGRRKDNEAERPDE